MPADPSDDLLASLGPTLWESAPDAMILVDAGGTIVAVNREAEVLFGYTRTELLGHPVERLVDPTAREHHVRVRRRYEADPHRRLLSASASTLTARTSAGEDIAVEIALSPVVHGDQRYTIAIVRDIRDRVRLEDRLRHLGTHDALTGLFNRGFLEAELERLDGSRQTPIGFIALDVDGLKRVNDHEGHAAGDALLRAAADILRGAVRTEDVVARIGGDEFAVLVPRADHAALATVAERIHQAVVAHNRATAPPVSLSLGQAVAQTGADIPAAMERADARMYANKRAKYAAAGDAPR